MYSPNNTPDDPDQQAFNVMWPVKDIKTNEGIFRDFLAGYGEAQFRSARLHTWFETPAKYFE